MMDSNEDCKIATMEQVLQMDVSSSIMPGESQQQRRIRLKPIPPPLVLSGDFNSLLTEFAIIATSPRSPLMQKNLPIRKRALSCSSMEAVQSPVHTNGVFSPPQSTTPLSTTHEEIEIPVPSPYQSSPIGVNGSSIKNANGGCINNWPVPVWHCFLKGTKIYFTVNSSIWKYAEDVGFQEMMKRKADNDLHTYAPHGLKLVEQFWKISEQLVRLRFRPISRDDENGAAYPKTQPDLEVECNSDHPFYAKDKGWSSIQPQMTGKQYGIPCRILEVNDVCLPPCHPDASFSPDIFESIRSFDFTPEDTSAVLALSNMAKHKQSTQMISGNAISPPVSPNKKYVAAESANSKPKRPMNGFMLFAKQHRVQYTQIYPGKDNRAISVLLGDSWKRMSSEERSSYAQRAKVLAEERKKLYPDCWKRRRSLSTSS